MKSFSDGEVMYDPEITCHICGEQKRDVWPKVLQHPISEEPLFFVMCCGSCDKDRRDEHLG